MGLMAASASKALKDYASRKFQRSLHQYEDLLAKAPNDPRLHFNAGDAAFESGFYDQAVKHFNSSLATEDLQLQERSFYNLGNAHYRIGEEEKEAPQKQANWEQAVTSYESALKLNPTDTDAKYNLELVKKKLEELKQQQQQNSQSSSSRRQRQQASQKKSGQQNRQASSQKSGQPNQKNSGQNPGAGGLGDKKNAGPNADLYKDIWGHLPETLRKEMDAYSRVEFMSKYNDLLQQYYKRISEKGRAKGD